MEKEKSDKKFFDLSGKNWEKKFFRFTWKRNKEKKYLSLYTENVSNLKRNQRTGEEPSLFATHVIPRLMSNAVFASQWLIRSHGHLGGPLHECTQSRAFFSVFHLPTLEAERIVNKRATQTAHRTDPTQSALQVHSGYIQHRICVTYNAKSTQNIAFCT